MHSTRRLLFCSQCAAEPAYLVSFDALGEDTTNACRDCIDHLYFSDTTSFAYIEVWDRQGHGVSFLWHGTHAFERWIQEDSDEPTARTNENRENATTVSSAPAIIDTLEAELVLRRQTRAQTRASRLASTSLMARFRKGRSIIAARHRIS